jgi:predicted transcriptional regulator
MSLRSQDKFRKVAKKALVERELTVTALATLLGKARNTVSMAINHPVFPSVRRQIAEELKLEGVEV